MDRSTLTAERDAVIAEYGPWGSHNVVLPFGLFTIGPEPRGDNYRAVKFLRLAADILKRPLCELRVLDLACGEGLYAIEFARQGCHVVGVEARLSTSPRPSSPKGCFLAALRGMCRGALFIDSRVAMLPDVEVTHDGRSYHGLKYREHRPDATEAERLADGGASIDNEASFWFTRASLANVLGDLGFTSVLECWMPRPLVLREDRATLVAIPGRSLHAFNEISPDLATARWPSTGAAEQHDGGQAS